MRRVPWEGALAELGGGEGRGAGRLCEGSGSRPSCALRTLSGEGLRILQLGLRNSGQVAGARWGRAPGTPGAGAGRTSAALRPAAAGCGSGAAEKPDGKEGAPPASRGGRARLCDGGAPGDRGGLPRSPASACSAPLPVLVRRSRCRPVLSSSAAWSVGGMCNSWWTRGCFREAHLTFRSEGASALPGRPERPRAARLVLSAARGLTWTASGPGSAGLHLCPPCS